MNSESDVDLEEKYIKSVAGTMYAGERLRLGALYFYTDVSMHIAGADSVRTICTKF